MCAYSLSEVTPFGGTNTPQRTIDYLTRNPLPSMGNFISSCWSKESRCSEHVQEISNSKTWPELCMQTHSSYDYIRSNQAKSPMTGRGTWWCNSGYWQLMVAGGERVVFLQKHGFWEGQHPPVKVSNPCTHRHNVYAVGLKHKEHMKFWGKGSGA